MTLFVAADMRSVLEFQLRKSLAVKQSLRDAEAELTRALDLHPAFRSAHEGHSVIEEEFDELWAEVKRKDRDPKALREEAVQLAAMALRFIVEVCDA